MPESTDIGLQKLHYLIIQDGKLKNKHLSFN